MIFVLLLGISPGLIQGQVQIGDDIDGTESESTSGESVALSNSGNRVAIGATFHDGGGVGNTGAVRMYDLIDGAWTQIGDDIDGEDPNELLGSSVDISFDGFRVVVGSPLNDEMGSDVGQVRMYDFINGAWTKAGIDINGDASGDQSGKSVAIGQWGSRVAIGAPGHNGGGLADNGQVRIFDFQAVGGWTQIGPDILGDAQGDESGSSVALSADGSRVAIGAPNHDGGGLEDSGQVRIFEETSDGATTWSQVGGDIVGEAEGGRKPCSDWGTG